MWRYTNCHRYMPIEYESVRLLEGIYGPLREQKSTLRNHEEERSAQAHIPYSRLSIASDNDGREQANVWVLLLPQALSLQGAVKLDADATDPSQTSTTHLSPCGHSQTTISAISVNITIQYPRGE